MGIPESIKEWSDWNRKPKGNTANKDLKYVCKSKRYVSDMQIQIEGIKAKLQGAESALGQEVESIYSALKAHVDDFFILFKKLLVPLRSLEADGTTEQMECKASLQNTDWEQCMSQAIIILKALKTLPDNISYELDNMRSQVLAVIDLCSRLATCSFTTRHRDLSPAEAKLIAQKLKHITDMSM